VKVLIAYRTRYGTAAECARSLVRRIAAESRLVDLALVRKPDVSAFDVVLIGGSVYGGKIQREVTSFCEREREVLLKKKVGLFLCCLYRGEHAKAQLREAFPQWLHSHAFAAALPGGELRFGSLRLLDRLLVRGLPHPPGDVLLLDPQALEDLAAAVNAP
jgi:menaquinone-dependent protoporphyrinogen oxidase